jgi:hypothetical protein
MKHRLAYAEAQKARLDDLAKSDRSVLLVGFGALFSFGVAVLFKQIRDHIYSTTKGYTNCWIDDGHIYMANRTSYRGWFW